MWRYDVNVSNDNLFDILTLAFWIIGFNLCLLHLILLFWTWLICRVCVFYLLITVSVQSVYCNIFNYVLLLFYLSVIYYYKNICCLHGLSKMIIVHRPKNNQPNELWQLVCNNFSNHLVVKSGNVMVCFICFYNVFLELERTTT